MNKIGRNDPCPCGSGKKYKQCCLRQEQEQATLAAKDPVHGASKAIEWLGSKHPGALREALYDGFFGTVNDEDLSRIEALDEETHLAVMTNAMEWVLAEGTCFYRDDEIPVTDLIVARGGLILPVEQRGWLKALRSHPLRVYEVLAVSPGYSVTLQDVLDPDRDEITVIENTASLSLLGGDAFAARIVPLEGNWVLSGATYPLNSRHVMDLISDFQREMEGHPPEDAEEEQEILSMVIRDTWLKALLDPLEMPDLMDHSTGEAILFITDHYRVKDWDRLEQVLQDQPQIEGSRAAGWDVLRTGEDGLVRSEMSIDTDEAEDGLTVFYRTQSHADQGKPWIENLAGEILQSIGREISDPKALMGYPEGGDAQHPLMAKELDQVSPEAMREVFEEFLRNAYKDWADQPIPILDGFSPRDMIKTPEGLIRVKFLIRTYQQDEQQQALSQNREAISLAFLWESLGLTPE